MGNLSIGNFRMPEDCPKCASNVTFERTYVPRGTCKVFPGVEHHTLGTSKVIATGPCLMKTCRVCTYTYTTPPEDGEGTEREDA